MRTLKHPHSWKRRFPGERKLDRDPEYICTNPDCFARTRFSIINGKRATCPECGDPFIVGDKDMKEPILKCPSCKEGITKLVEEKLQDKQIEEQLEVKIPTVDIFAIQEQIKKINSGD